MMAVALGGCSFFTSANLSRSTVVAQAAADGEVAYDVVKVDDAVIKTVLAHAPASFGERFKTLAPPPERKIAIGDVLSVVIWESSPEGLFGNSLWDTLTAQGLPLARAPSAGANIGTPGLFRDQSLTGSDGGATAAQRPQAFLSDVGTITSTANRGTSPSWAASPESSGLGTLLPDGDVQRQSAAGSGFGITPPSAQWQEMEASALGASRETRVATGLPNPPVSLENLEQVGRPGTRIPLQEVGSDGAITIPYAGRIPVIDRTPQQVERLIDQRLAGKAVDPQALVAVLRSPANSVTVSGESIGGKRVPLNADERLLDVIAAAGGTKAPVHETFVELSRDGVTATVPLARLVDRPADNLYARPGDVLTLVQRPRSFSVFGATGKNAAVTFTHDRLSLSEALAQSGGLLDEKADPRAVFLFRYEPDAVVQALGQPLATQTPKGVSPVAYRFDLKDPKSYLWAKEFPVQDKDIVFVANAEIQPVYRFFTALQNVAGPVVTGFLACQSGGC
jgi:polysaccharide export outer membrane protein